MIVFCQKEFVTMFHKDISDSQCAPVYLSKENHKAEKRLSE